MEGAWGGLERGIILFFIFRSYGGLTWNRQAHGERVSAVTGHATADGAVINDHAIGIEPARTRAGVHAFVVLAR